MKFCGDKTTLYIKMEALLRYRFCIRFANFNLKISSYAPFNVRICNERNEYFKIERRVLCCLLCAFAINVGCNLSYCHLSHIIYSQISFVDVILIDHVLGKWRCFPQRSLFFYFSQHFIRASLSCTK